MKTPSPRGRYIYNTKDMCLVSLKKEQDNSWSFAISAEDSTLIRGGACWISKKRALEDIQKALEETGHPPELKQIAAQYIYDFKTVKIDVHGNERNWHWVCGKVKGSAKSKSAALKAAMKGIE